jgi:hypothetical protein
VTRVGWLDCSSGVSGDMLLGALTDLGALDLTDLSRRLQVGAEVTVGEVTRSGVAARQVVVVAGPDQPTRRLTDVLELIAHAELPATVTARATATFTRIAEVEAVVHGTTPDDVRFHEVGAVDAVVDVVGTCLGLAALGLDALVASTVSLGGGWTSSAHGALPVPGPAVLGLLAGGRLAAAGGPVDVELATPTGVALLATWATASGPMPAMTVERVGVGAGGRDLDDRPNVLRLVVGESRAAGSGELLVVEANVDDLDPRLWPGVLDRLLATGALDAWLTPILMKKGRPAHTVAALVSASDLPAVRHCLLAETSTIGVRESVVTKHALQRSWITVAVDGQDIRVKLAGPAAHPTNVSPEFEDVAAAAQVLGVPVKDVLARASAAAITQLG